MFNNCSHSKSSNVVVTTGGRKLDKLIISYFIYTTVCVVCSDLILNDLHIFVLVFVLAKLILTVLLVYIFLCLLVLIHVPWTNTVITLLTNPRLLQEPSKEIRPSLIPTYSTPHFMLNTFIYYNMCMMTKAVIWWQKVKSFIKKIIVTTITCEILWHNTQRVEKVNTVMQWVLIKHFIKLPGSSMGFLAFILVVHFPYQSQAPVRLYSRVGGEAPTQLCQVTNLWMRGDYRALSIQRIGALTCLPAHGT